MTFRSTLALAFAAAACGGGSDYSTGPAPSPGPIGVATITVAAPFSTVFVGASHQLTATTKDASGNTLTGRAVVWSTSSTAVATVSSAGIATATGPGTATITAASELKTGTVVLTVPEIFADLGTILIPADYAVTSGPVADPTAIQLSDGRVRIYLFAQGKGTRSAISTNASGTAFTPEPGMRSTQEFWGQPRIIKLSNSSVRLFYTSADGVRSAISTDGLAFTEEPGTRIANATTGYEIGAMSIVPLSSGGFRAYFSDLERPGAPPGGHFIRSATSTDMLAWTLEPGIIMGVGATSGIMGTSTHPFAHASADGSVTLYYQGERSDPAIQGGSYRGIYRARSTDGRTFATEERTGIRFGGDPDVITLADGSIMMYYGDVITGIGGVVRAARVNR